MWRGLQRLFWRGVQSEICRVAASPYPACRFSTNKRKKAILPDGLFTCLMPGSSLLSHGETPHYHRRYGVSLLSSAWGQVGPPRYSRQANSCALSCVFRTDTALAALVKSVTYLSMLLPFLRLPPCLSAK